MICLGGTFVVESSTIELTTITFAVESLTIEYDTTTIVVESSTIELTTTAFVVESSTIVIERSTIVVESSTIECHTTTFGLRCYLACHQQHVFTDRRTTDDALDTFAGRNEVTVVYFNGTRV